jgi:hypothetical protein
METSLATRLEEAEKQIAAGAEQTRAGLLEVRNNRLYRDKYPSFEEYCLKRWGMSRARGYQLLQAAEVIAEVKMDKECLTMVDTLPDRTAVELGKAPKGERAEVWKEAVATAPQKNGKPKVTAKHVEKVVASRKQPEPEPEKPAPPDPQPWRAYNDLIDHSLALLDELEADADRMRTTEFGGWRNAKEDKLFFSNWRVTLGKYKVTGWAPQNHKPPTHQSDNFLYQHETPKRGAR